MTNYFSGYTDEFIFATPKTLLQTKPSSDDDAQGPLWEGSPSVLPDYLLDDPEDRLRLGMPATVRIPLGTPPAAR